MWRKSLSEGHLGQIRPHLRNPRDTPLGGLKVGGGAGSVD